MSLVVSYRLARPLLQETLTAVPTMQLRVEQEAALCTTETLLTVRATGNEFDALEAALERDRTVSNVAVLDRGLDDERVYTVTVPASEST